MRLDQLCENRIPLAIALAFRLVRGPLVLALLYVGVLSRKGETTQVTLFEAAMGPQIGGAGSTITVRVDARAPPISEQGRADFEKHSGRRTHSADANSRRTTPSVCSDLISDRDRT
jgi:hypothetical protein